VCRDDCESGAIISRKTFYEEVVEMENKVRYIWAAVRVALGWTFLWAFLDKLFGLGFATPPDQAWLAGGSPTSGYLTHATAGPLAGFYQGIAGSPVINWLFMLGLLGLGVSLTLGIGTRIAGYAGALFMLLLWSSHLPPASNPILDQHIIYALTLLGLSASEAGQTLGLGKWWAERVKSFSFVTALRAKDEVRVK
jgi:thiosulfate dehydrogenase [quinone] large subunit